MSLKSQLGRTVPRVLAAGVAAVAVAAFGLAPTADAAAPAAAKHAAPAGKHKKCGRHRVLKRRHGRLRCVKVKRHHPHRAQRPKAPAPAAPAPKAPAPTAPGPQAPAPQVPVPTAPQPGTGSPPPGPIGQPPVPPLPVPPNARGPIAHAATTYVFEGCTSWEYDNYYRVWWIACDWAGSDFTILRGFYFWNGSQAQYWTSRLFNY